MALIEALYPWIMILVAVVAYRHGRAVERNIIALETPAPQAPPSSLPPDSIVPILTGQEREMVWKHPIQAIRMIRDRSGCSLLNAKRAVEAEKEEGLPPTTRSRR